MLSNSVVLPIARASSDVELRYSQQDLLNHQYQNRLKGDFTNTEVDPTHQHTGESVLPENFADKIKKNWPKYANEEAEYGTDDVVDHRSSDGQSGVKTPIDWFLPKVPDPEKVDPDEYRDYLHTTDAPYALLKLPFDLSFGPEVIKTGFYHVKFSMPNAVPQPPRRFFGFKGPHNFYPPQYPEQVTSPNVTLMLKKEGEIVIKIPISGTFHVTAPPKPKWYQLGKKLQAHIEERPAPIAAIRPINNIAANMTSGGLMEIVYCDENICYQSIPLSPSLLK